VPSDINLEEGREFMITVTYDTLELYGKVVGSRTFHLAPN